MLSGPALVDLIAILPFFVHAFVGFEDLRILRIFRLLRFFRLFRLTAYMKATKLVKNVFKSTFNELVLSLVLALFLIIISSSLVYFAEHQAQPDKFKSIPSTIWWSVVTLIGRSGHFCSSCWHYHSRFFRRNKKKEKQQAWLMPSLWFAIGR